MAGLDPENTNTVNRFLTNAHPNHWIVRRQLVGWIIDLLRLVLNYIHDDPEGKQIKSNDEEIVVSEMTCMMPPNEDYYRNKEENNDLININGTKTETKKQITLIIQNLVHINKAPHIGTNSTETRSKYQE